MSPQRSRRKENRSPTAAAPPLHQGHGIAPARRLRVLAAAALIALTASVAYLPSLRGGFILDDDILLTNSKLIRAPDGIYRFWCTTEPIDYWPVSNTALWLEWRLWGMQSIPYHVTGLVLHIVAALLIAVILQRLRVPGAFLAALLFAVHPVNVESVAWIAQRKNLMAMCFYLVSILAYLKAETTPSSPAQAAPREAAGWYGLSVAAFLLAILSKGSVAILPPVLLLLVWWLRPLTRRDLLRVAPFVVISAVLVPVNAWFQKRVIRAEFPTSDAAERLLGAAGAVWFYLSKAALPINLSFVYPRWHIDAHQVRWWLPLLAVVATTAVLWRCRQGRGRPLLFAWSYFCVALLPVLGFADVGFMQHSLVADHYQHLALIGVTALAAAGWDTWRRRALGPAHWMPHAVAVVIVCALGALTWQRSGLYADSITLFEATLQQNPESWMTHNNLGVALRDAGRLPEAIDHYEQALRLFPEYPEAHYNAGIALAQVGRLEEAIRHYRQAVRLTPNYADAHYNLGIALTQSGQLQEAIGQFEEAVRLKPDFPEAHNNLGSALAQAGQIQAAIEHFQHALRLRPGFSDAQDNLRIAQGMQRRGSAQ